MATGTTLEQLVDQLRGEIGASSSPAQGVNVLPAWQQVLRRTQERLYDDWNWPQFKIERDVPMLAGERYYTFPSDIDFDRIEGDRVKVKYSGWWQPVANGFDSQVYNAANSDAGVRQNPVRAWRHFEGNQFEVWPIPADNAQTVRFVAYKKLSPLIANSDTADLDDMMIVLYAAAELLARMKSDDAGSKLQLAQNRYAKMKQRSMKSGTIIMGGGVPSMGGGGRIMWGAPIVDNNPNPT